MDHRLYADDLTLVASGPNRQAQLQRGLDIISEWCKEFFMEGNVSKTEYADFKARKVDPLALYLHGVKLRCVRTPKLLGVTLNHSSGFSDHADALKRSSAPSLLKIAAVGNTAWGACTPTLRCFYLATVESSLLYACPAWWGAMSRSCLEHLSSVQAKGARGVAGLPATASNQDALPEADLE